MKKIFLAVCVMGLMACQEEGATSSAKDAQPSQPTQQQPEVKKAIFTINTSEPTEIMLKVERLIDDVGFDVNNPETITITTAKPQETIELPLRYKCRVYFYKQANLNGSTGTVTIGSKRIATLNLPSEFSGSEMFIMQDEYFQ